MKKIPADRKYTEGHLWFQSLSQDEGIVGVTDHIQMRAGDVISAELPRVGRTFAVNDVVACLEGILETLEVEAFASFEVLETNPRLDIHPDIVNRAPYAEGWLMRVKLKGVPRLFTAPQYAEYLENGVIQEGA